MLNISQSAIDNENVLSFCRADACEQQHEALLGCHTSRIISSLTKVKHTLSILQIYWKYTSKLSILKAYFKYTPSILQVYFKYTSSILQPVELQKKKKKKYTSSLCYFDKRSTFEAHFVKLNQYFNVNLKYASSIL